MTNTTNYTEAQNRLAQARREMRANELRIKAYEHKLKKDIDPDSPDWDKTLAKLEELRTQGDEILLDLARAVDAEKKLRHELQAAV